MFNMFQGVVAACLLATATLFSASALGADTPATKPAATQASAPACCGDACKPMPGCCKADDKGVVACAMGGSCCVQPDAKKADGQGTGGMHTAK